MYQFSNVVLGGTFDRLHSGHKAFLQFALSVSEHIYLGLTSDEYVQKVKKVSNSLPFDDRKSELEKYLKGQHALHRVQIVTIDANEIPTSLQGNAQAIIATTDTLQGAEELNRKRQKMAYDPLPIVPFPLKKGVKGTVISSTHIRKGEMDRKGNPYLREDMQEYSYVLPTSLRPTLQQPLGGIVDMSSRQGIRDTNALIVTVGDVTTATFLKHTVFPSLAVIDFVVERKKMYSHITELGFSGREHVYRVENPKSHIRPEVFITLSHLFTYTQARDETSILQVGGEEDLIVLPVVLLAPLGTLVYYGQPGVGMVEVIVTEQLKQTMRELLEKFEKEKDEKDE